MYMFKNRGGERSWYNGFAIIMLLNVILKSLMNVIKHIKERRAIKSEKR